MADFDLGQVQGYAIDINDNKTRSDRYEGISKVFDDAVKSSAMRNSDGDDKRLQRLWNSGMQNMDKTIAAGLAWSNLEKPGDMEKTMAAGPAWTNLPTRSPRENSKQLGGNGAEEESEGMLKTKAGGRAWSNLSNAPSAAKVLSVTPQSARSLTSSALSRTQNADQLFRSRRGKATADSPPQRAMSAIVPPQTPQRAMSARVPPNGAMSARVPPQGARSAKVPPDSARAVSATPVKAVSLSQSMGSVQRQTSAVVPPNTGTPVKGVALSQSMGSVQRQTSAVVPPNTGTPVKGVALSQSMGSVQRQTSALVPPNSARALSARGVNAVALSASARSCDGSLMQMQQQIGPARAASCAAVNNRLTASCPSYATPVVTAETLRSVKGAGRNGSLVTADPPPSAKALDRNTSTEKAYPQRSNSAASQSRTPRRRGASPTVTEGTRSARSVTSSQATIAVSQPTRYGSRFTPVAKAAPSNACLTPRKAPSRTPARTPPPSHASLTPRREQALTPRGESSATALTPRRGMNTQSRPTPTQMPQDMSGRFVCIAPATSIPPSPAGFIQQLESARSQQLAASASQFGTFGSSVTRQTSAPITTAMSNPRSMTQLGGMGPRSNSFQHARSPAPDSPTRQLRRQKNHGNLSNTNLNYEVHDAKKEKFSL